MSEPNGNNSQSTFDEPKKKSKSINNFVNKNAPAATSLVEYVFVKGIGKTIKNFATEARDGAKQGYQHVTTEKNMHTAMMDAYNELNKLVEVPDNKKQYHNNCLLPEQFFNLFMACPGKYDSLRDNAELQYDFVSQLEKIVQNQIKNWSTLTLDNQHNKSLTKELSTTLEPMAKIKKLENISVAIFDKMYKERAKQPDFIATTRKIEQYKKDLDNIELPNLAGAAGISDKTPYKNAQTYEEKIDLIRIKLEADQKQSIPQSHINDSKSKIQNFAKEDQQLTNTSFEDIKKTVDNLRRARTNSSNSQHPIEMHLKRLKTAQQTLAKLKAAEEQLLNPKQNRLVRALKAVAGVPVGIIRGLGQGTKRGIQTAFKATVKAPEGISEIYQKHRERIRPGRDR